MAGLREHYRRKVLYFKIDSADATIVCVAAPASTEQIVVLSLVLTGVGADTVDFKSATTIIFPHVFKATAPGLVLPDGDNGYFETAKGEALNLTNPGTVALTGCGSYYVL